MRNPSVILCLACAVSLLLTACGTQRGAIGQESQDTRIETRYERIFVHDTAYIEIPGQTSEKTVRDSTSRIENEYAVSEARINSDGSLFHSLRTKAQKKPVPVEKVVERKDSIVYVDKEVKAPVTVERKMTAWQTFRLRYFSALAAVAFALACYLFRKPFAALIRRFI